MSVYASLGLENWTEKMPSFWREKDGKAVAILDSKQLLVQTRKGGEENTVMGYAVAPPAPGFLHESYKIFLFF